MIADQPTMILIGFSPLAALMFFTEPVNRRQNEPSKITLLQLAETIEKSLTGTGWLCFRR
jgi:hypothetical protein